MNARVISFYKRKLNTFIIIARLSNFNIKKFDLVTFFKRIMYISQHEFS